MNEVVHRPITRYYRCDRWASGILAKYKTLDRNENALWWLGRDRDAFWEPAWYQWTFKELKKSYPDLYQISEEEALRITNNNG